MGMPPTYKQIEMEVLMFHRIVDGQIVRQYSQADVTLAMGQMGVLPGSRGA